MDVSMSLLILERYGVLLLSFRYAQSSMLPTNQHNLDKSSSSPFLLDIIHKSITHF